MMIITRVKFNGTKAKYYVQLRKLFYWKTVQVKPYHRAEDRYFDNFDAAIQFAIHCAVDVTVEHKKNEYKPI